MCHNASRWSNYTCCGAVCPKSSRTSFLVRNNTYSCHLWQENDTADCWLPSCPSCHQMFDCFCSLHQWIVPSHFFLSLTWSFFSATILSCGWIIYLTYYNSRNIGLILTLIINRLYKDGYIHIGERVRTSVKWWLTGRWNSAKAFSSRFNSATEYFTMSRFPQWIST